MRPVLFLWGVILLIGFYLTHLAALQNFDERLLWISWAVIFNVGHFLIGRSMKSSATIGRVWMQANLFGLILTIILVSGLVAVNYVLLMGIWFVIIGAAMFATGYENKNMMSLSTALILLFSSLLVVGLMGSYFLVGGLILGLLMLLYGLLEGGKDVARAKKG